MSDALIAELQERSWALQAQGRVDEACSACAQALALVEEAGDGCMPDAANLLNELAELHLDQGDVGGALEHAARAKAIATRRKSPWQGEDAARIRMKTCALLGEMLRMQGRLVEAEVECRNGLALALAQFGLESSEVAEARNNLAVLFKTLGRHAEARALYEEALQMISRAAGEHSLAAAVVLHNIGGILHAQGDFSTAEPYARRAWEISSALLGQRDSQTLQDRAAHAAILDGLGRHAESEAIYREVLAAWRALHGEEHQEVAATLHNLAAAVEARGARAEAEECYRDALAIQCRLLDADAVDIALTLNNLGRLLAGRGAVDEAVAMLARATASLGTRLEAGHPWLLAAQENLAVARSGY